MGGRSFGYASKGPADKVKWFHGGDDHASQQQRLRREGHPKVPKQSESAVDTWSVASRRGGSVADAAVGRRYAAAMLGRSESLKPSTAFKSKIEDSGPYSR